jgi:hypothetical protein
LTLSYFGNSFTCKNYFCSETPPIFLINYLNSSLSKEERDVWKLRHNYVHSYCIHCNHTIDQDFNTTLYDPTSKCKYFDKTFCKNKCQDPNFVCLYIEKIPICYSPGYNQFMSNIDFLHTNFLAYYSVWNNITLSIISGLLFMLVFVFSFIPTIVATFFEMNCIRGCCFNFYKLFRIKTICILELMISLLVVFVGCLFDIGLEFLSSITVLVVSIHTVFLLWIIFQLIVLW